MEKTININLAGLLFRVEEKAFNLLRDYLQSVNNRFKNIEGGSETIEDIESRIAEIFLSKGGKESIITLSNVEEMIKVMGQPEDYTEEEETKSSFNPSRKRRLYRDPDDSIIAGVASGLGGYLRMDSVWVRLIFILTSLFGGAGFFLYIVLWVVLPVADSESRKRELYGDDYMAMIKRRARGSSSAGNTPTDNLARGLNSLFSAIGRVILIFFRVILGLIGLAFLVGGFSVLVGLLIVIFFNHIPVMASSIDPLIFNLRALMGIIVEPSSVTLLLILIAMVTMLPMAAMVYWGIRMIFQFRIRDGIFNLVMFLVWLLALVALVFVSVAQGLNFNDHARSVSTIQFSQSPDTLFLRTGESTASLEWDKVLGLPDSDGPSLYFDKRENRIYGTPRISLRYTDDELSSLEVRKYSSAISSSDSHQRAEQINFVVTSSGKEIQIDEYFSLPVNTRYRGDHVKVVLYISEGTILWIDESLEKHLDNDRYGHMFSWQMGNKYWVMTEEGLEEIE